jgi:hypothetical protein
MGYGVPNRFIVRKTNVIGTATRKFLLLCMISVFVKIILWSKDRDLMLGIRRQIKQYWATNK